MSTIRIAGSAGIYYEYEVCDMYGGWRDVGGNYAFAYLQGGLWRLLYVGQCASFQQRMASHERWPEAVVMGATHVLAQENRLEPMRLLQEYDIIRLYQPPMNIQHRAA